MNYDKESMIRNNPQPRCVYGYTKRPMGMVARRCTDCDGDCMDKESCEKHRKELRNVRADVA